MFYLTTCVGYGYGPYMHIARGFSRQYRITNFTQHMGYASRLTHIDNRISPSCRATRLHRNPISGYGYLTASPHH